MELLNVAIPLLKAVNGAYPGKSVWLAVETSGLCADAELISYARNSAGTLMSDLATAEKNAIKESSGFAGIAIHSYKDFVALGG